jgi:(E)-4-hydroxy-3-methylbut-2-enyl-diphosphate synthase
MKPFCEDLFGYKRIKTSSVTIGELTMGGDAPIRVQSMTTADTMNTEATVAESIRMIEAGCELVRITAPSKNEAENLRNIREELQNVGYNIPLVADIHFTPNAAEIAARIVEKVRVNPGNYADKKKFEEIVYTDESYAAELKRIRDRFIPLVEICKEHGTAMRIGTNHGSLSDRILSRYGDTPEGMVESAMEFIRICLDCNYKNLVISMKASNPQVMVQAYRLLVQTLLEAGEVFPLHLGVTEAGDGEDGDTVRVSLTEAPEAEMPVAKLLVDRYANRTLGLYIPAEEIPIDFFSYSRRHTHEVLNIGGKNVPRVFADYSNRESITVASLFAVGYAYSIDMDKWNLSDSACDYLFVGKSTVNFEIPGTLGVVMEHATWLQHKNRDRHYPVLSASEYLQPNERSGELNFVEVELENLTEEFLSVLKADSTVVLLLKSSHEYVVQHRRTGIFRLMNHGVTCPVVLSSTYNIEEEAYTLYSSTDVGALLLDGLGDGVLISSSQSSLAKSNAIAFGILQATRTRISRTEYISCPSCGRTLFDLQETTAKIRSRTSHLKGVKIGIMGCIVNGPGEMADADYGYVGTGVGKITLYKEKNVVKKNIDEAEAVDELISLIKEYGDWVEPA